MTAPRSEDKPDGTPDRPEQIEPAPDRQKSPMEDPGSPGGTGGTGGTNHEQDD